MTKEEARKAAEVMLAYANGEKIERTERTIDYKPEWFDAGSDCQFDWFAYEYRVKPKEKFNPKTLQAFDRVLVRNENYQVWQCDLFSHIKNGGIQFMYRCVSSSHKCCIPYNDDTKHLVGTNEEAPEYYRYWEK